MGWSPPLRTDELNGADGVTAGGKAETVEAAATAAGRPAPVRALPLSFDPS